MDGAFPTKKRVLTNFFFNPNLAPPLRDELGVGHQKFQWEWVPLTVFPQKCEFGRIFFIFFSPTLHPPRRVSSEPSRQKTVLNMFMDRVLRFLKVAAQNWRITCWGFFVIGNITALPPRQGKRRDGSQAVYCYNCDFWQYVVFLLSLIHIWRCRRRG